MALEARHQATRQGTAKPPGIPSAGRSKVVGECGVEGGEWWSGGVSNRWGGVNTVELIGANKVEVVECNW